MIDEDAEMCDPITAGGNCENVYVGSRGHEFRRHPGLNLPVGVSGNSREFLVLLCEENGLRECSTVGGGDCFFDSVSKSLELVYGVTLGIKELRRRLSDYLQEHVGDYEERYAFEYEPGGRMPRELNEYIVRVGSSKEEIIALGIDGMARVLDICIRVVIAQTVVLYNESAIERGSMVITVGYEASGASGHYTALLPR